jgi:hypothetical protein
MAAIAKSLIPQNLREPEPLQPIVMPESAPQPLPPTPQPQVQLAPRVPTPLDQQIQHDQQKLQKIHFQQENPWGTAQNHPGVGGKIAHVLSVAGNIAGDIFAPGVMARIPGTQMNRQVEEDETNDRLSKEQEQQSQGAERQANTEHLNAETPEIAPNAASTRKLQGLTGEHVSAETNLLNNPLEEWKAIPSIIGPNGEPVEIESRSGNVRLGGVQGTQLLKQPKPDTPEQQYIDEYQRLHKGATIAQAERQYSLDTQKPPQAIMLVPGENGGYTAQRVAPGATVAPGAVSATQAGSLNVPTTQQRNVAAQAKLVTEQMPGLISEIQQNKDLLGPVSGRWNEFMQGKAGVDNPQMAGLRADLLMMSSAVALMHARGRLPENLREEFDRAINAPKQTPENLIATLQHINQWTQANINAMRGNQGAQSPNTSAGPKEGDTKVNGAGIKVKFSDGKWGPA